LADQLASQVADGLLARGLRRGDIVMMFCENSVEGVLLKLGVAKAVVVGLPHERWGEAVTAVVVRRAGSVATGAELIAFCRAVLAGYETPKDVLFVDALPETVGGKVLKYKLRADHSGHFWGQSGSS
jgi:acyl-CoA synthetase (AMP-forming)/AMP-acid ligase II